MADFVNLDPRAAAWPMARPAAPVTPAVGVWPTVKITGESAAKERPATEAPPPAKPATDEPARRSAPAPQTSGSTTSGPSGPFMAQRLAQESAQESESQPEPRPVRTAAMAAYLRTRDSHIQIMRSVQTLDLRV